MVFTLMMVRTKLVSISTVGNNNRKKVLLEMIE